MTESDSRSIACPRCGKAYAWQKKFLGNELTCQCGCVFRAIPPQKEVEQDDAVKPMETYQEFEAAFQAESPVLRALNEREDERVVSRIPDWHLPIVMLIGGWLLFIVALSQVLSGDTQQLFKAVLLQTCLGLLVYAPSIFAGAYLIGSWFDKPLGLLYPAILKCLAVALGGSLISDIGVMTMYVLMNQHPTMPILGFGFYIPTVVLPLMLFFRFNPSEAAGATAIMYFPKIILIFIAQDLFPWLF